MSDAWSTSLVASKAPAEVVRRNRERTTKERHGQEIDAFLFLTVDHDAYAGELNRNYDPMPYPEAMPTPEADYIDSAIGFLYGLNERAEFAADLAGWNVRRAA
jgi:hypothetical protein